MFLWFLYYELKRSFATKRKKEKNEILIFHIFGLSFPVSFLFLAFINACKIEEKENINTMYRVKEKERQIKTMYI